MSFKITTEANIINVTIHDVDKLEAEIERIDQLMRQQPFWGHENTSCSLQSVLPDPVEKFAEAIGDQVNYNDYSCEDGDVIFEMDGSDYNATEFQSVVERFSSLAKAINLEEIEIYGEDDGFYVAFVDGSGDQMDFYRFDYEEEDEDEDDEDKDEDENEVVAESSENNFLDDIFTPSPKVTVVAQASVVQTDQDRALTAAREAAEWFSKQLGVTVNDTTV